MYLCQLILLCFLALSFFAALRSDFYPRTAREPYGFSGAIITVLMTALLAWCYWKAGAFSLLFSSALSR